MECRRRRILVDRLCWPSRRSLYSGLHEVCSSWRWQGNPSPPARLDLVEILHPCIWDIVQRFDLASLVWPSLLTKNLSKLVEALNKPTSKLLTVSKSAIQWNLGLHAITLHRRRNRGDGGPGPPDFFVWGLSLIHIWRCRRSTLCRSRWSPYH